MLFDTYTYRSSGVSEFNNRAIESALLSGSNEETAGLPSKGFPSLLFFLPRSSQQGLNKVS